MSSQCTTNSFKLLSTQNSKIKRATLKTLNFGVPSFRSATGMVTCPMAGVCAKGCYASQGLYSMSTVKLAYERRLEATKSHDFVERIIAEIKALNPQAYRWNDSGDFYSLSYLRKVIEIAKATPRVKHYAYTKQVSMVKSVRLPTNLIIIFSYGGKEDSLICESDRHARVFSDDIELKLAGYADASIDDSIAMGKSKKIGLIYHGFKSRSWNTNKGDNT